MIRYKPVRAQMNAGGSVTNIEQVRDVTKGNCKDLEVYVQNQEGKIPIFGYPLLAFSPGNNGRSLTDKKTWRIARLGNGEILKKDDPMLINEIPRSSSNSQKATREGSPR